MQILEGRSKIVEVGNERRGIAYSVQVEWETKRSTLTADIQKMQEDSNYLKEE